MLARGKRCTSASKGAKMAEKVIGITGGIASGKTTALAVLQQLGAMVISADDISHFLLEKHQKGYNGIKKLFPSAFVGDELSRSLLREIVANDKSSLALLNSFMHPLIINELKQGIEFSKGVVFIEVPLLFECELDTICDYVVSISASEQLRINRIKARDNTVTDAQAQTLIRAQFTDEERNRRADEVIYNESGREIFEEKIKDLFLRVGGKK